MSEQEQPNQEQPSEVLRAVYEHLRWVRDEQSAFHRDFLGKVQRLMTAQVLLFAGMGFSLRYFDWVWKRPDDLLWLGSLGVLAALFLLVGFLCAVHCLRVSRASVVGVKVLENTVKEGHIEKLRPSDLHSDLSQNIARAINEERDRFMSYTRWGRLLNCTTMLGTIFVAVFVAAVLLGKAFFSVDGAN